MSRNFHKDKLFKIDQKNSKKSTSFDQIKKEIYDFKCSIEKNCSSSKNSLSNKINFVNNDASLKKSSCRLSKKKSTVIP